jgi:hypothetical protein
MQTQALEGYMENGLFHTAGQIIKLPEKKKLFITIPGDSNDYDDPNDLQLRLAWLDELEAAIELSVGEEFPFIARSTEMRELVDLTD